MIERRTIRNEEHTLVLLLVTKKDEQGRPREATIYIEDQERIRMKDGLEFIYRLCAYERTEEAIMSRYAPNADPILRHRKGEIWQGNVGSVWEDSPDFDLVVMCAMTSEYELMARKLARSPRQSARTEFLHAPNDDGVLTRDQMRTACLAAHRVAAAYLSGRQVLVSCMEGRNRSGLVTALAIVSATGMTGAQASRLVQERRKGAAALTNENFTRFLERVVKAGR